MGAFWLRRGCDGFDKRAEQSMDDSLISYALNINAEDNFALAA